MNSTYYKIGEIINPLPSLGTKIKPKFTEAYVKIPSRVDTFLSNHHFFVNPPRTQVYPVGSINFVIQAYTEAKVKITSSPEIVIKSDKRKDIILHTALILKKHFNYEGGFEIEARNLHNIIHGGLGSSASLQTAVAMGINELFGSAIPSSYLIRFLAQNYGEESDRHGYLNSMASIGGASAAGILSSNLIVIGGESDVWYNGNLPEGYTAVIAIPKITKLPDGMADMELFRKGKEMFLAMGTQWGFTKDYIVRSKIIPGLLSNNFSQLFRSINYYTIGAYGDIPLYFANRWSNHSLFLDSFIHNMFYKIYCSRSVNEHCFFVSSGGPSIVIITNSPEEIKEICVEEGFQTVEIIELDNTKTRVEILK